MIATRNDSLTRNEKLMMWSAYSLVHVIAKWKKVKNTLKHKANNAVDFTFIIIQSCRVIIKNVSKWLSK